MIASWTVVPTFRPMIVCVCNGLSERKIRAAVECRGSCTIGDVYRCLGCRVRCGKCVPFVAEIARAARPVTVLAASAAVEEPGSLRQERELITVEAA